MAKRILVALVFLTTCATAILPRLARGGSSAEQDVRNLEEQWLQNEDDPPVLEPPRPRLPFTSALMDL